MKVHNALTDDDGVKWEFRYEENMFVPVLNFAGEQIVKNGQRVTTSKVTDLRYRRVGDETWSSLPSWADIQEDWKINLCFFDEDEDTGEMTYWDVRSQMAGLRRDAERVLVLVADGAPWSGAESSLKLRRARLGMLRRLVTAHLVSYDGEFWTATVYGRAYATAVRAERASKVVVQLAQVILYRIENGLYGVIVHDADGVTQTPLRVRRHRQTRESKAWGNHHGSIVAEHWWQVEFDRTLKLGEREDWYARMGGAHVWDYEFSTQNGDGFDTLRDARLRLEEVLSAAEAGVDQEAASVHLGGDAGGGAGAGGTGGG